MSAVQHTNKDFSVQKFFRVYHLTVSYPVSLYSVNGTSKGKNTSLWSTKAPPHPLLTSIDEYLYAQQKEQEKSKGGREELTAHAVRAQFGSPGARIPKKKTVI
jgi:hypothetical protein